jgi:hypothetical protein
MNKAPYHLVNLHVLHKNVIYGVPGPSSVSGGLETGFSSFLVELGSERPPTSSGTILAFFLIVFLLLHSSFFLLALATKTTRSGLLSFDFL